VTDTWQITDNTGASRLELTLDGQRAELGYRIRGQRLVILHTGVPPALEGRGIGGALVMAALDRAARDGLTVVPLCPFARDWLKRHPDAAAGTAIDWGTGDEPPG
jgi:hypothetical protein